MVEAISDYSINNLLTIDRQKPLFVKIDSRLGQPTVHVSVAVPERAWGWEESTISHGRESGRYVGIPKVDSSSIIQRACSKSATAIKILIVEDDVHLVASLKRTLRPHGYDVRATHDAASAMSHAQAYQPDVILLDVKLPYGNGWIVAHQLRQSVDTSDIAFILMTGLVQPDIQSQAASCGATLLLEKPFRPKTLLASIATALN